MHKLGLAVGAAIVLTGAGVGVAAATAPPAGLASCAVTAVPIYQVVNPTSQASLVTPSRSEADNARTRYGFTVDNGAIFHAPAAAAAGLNPVVRMYHPGSGDFFWTADAAEAASARDRYGYQLQQTDFHASPAPLACTVPVHRLVKGQIHRLAPPSAVPALTAAGWTDEGVRFHAFPSPSTTLPLDPVLGSGQLGDAVYTFSDFPVSRDGRQVGAVVPAAGLAGRGRDRSVVRMNPNTSTKASLVPPNDPTFTNPIDLLLVVGRSSAPATPTLRDFTLQATPQGHLYNGLRMSYTQNARLTNLRVVAVPGNYHINPGETFGINDWRGRGNVYTNVEVDGAGVGASALGFNSSTDVTVNGAYLHHNPYSAGVAAWQTTNVTLTDVRTVANRTGLNFERVAGTVVITRPTIQGNTEQDMFIGSDLGSARYTITDPALGPGARLRIRLPATEMGRPNLQRREDIRVYANGVDVTASVVQWL